jgi:hypothetical protein
MKESPKAPAEKSEPSAFERMKEFTRRLIAVPREEVLAKQKPKRRKQR